MINIILVTFVLKYSYEPTLYNIIIYTTYSFLS